MAFIQQHWRIIAASTLAAAMIVGAFIAAEGAAGPPIAQAATESALLNEIASRDSTGDGLPDWEKPLYGIPLDATTTDYFHLGMTDGAAVAKGLVVPIANADIAPSSSPVSTGVDAPAGAPDGTLTAAFAQNFFTLYLNAKEANNGADLTSDQITSIADQALSALNDSVSPTPDFKTAADINVSGSGAQDLTTYATNAANVFGVNNPSLPESELIYLQNYVENDDPAAIENLKKIATSYTNISVGLAALTAPQEAAAADLALINAASRIGSITADFARVDTDPVAAMLALEQYSTAVTALANAFQTLGAAYQNAGVALDPNTPGGALVNVLSGIATSSASTP